MTSPYRQQGERDDYPEARGPRWFGRGARFWLKICRLLGWVFLGDMLLGMYRTNRLLLGKYHREIRNLEKEVKVNEEILSSAAELVEKIVSLESK